MRLVTDIFAFCAAELPRWNSISISGYHMREAGATAAQELAFTLADAIAYVEGAVARGLDVDAFAGRLSFFFGAWSELFEEVAKFRAARRMWARIMRDRFGATDPRSMMCRFHVQTAGSSLTAQSIDNNVVRTTIQALAAVLGGTQSLHTNARDEALALPTAESARLALRTQQILAHEAGVTETPDPLAGSYFVETLTDQLEAAAQAYLDEIEAMGGAIAAIEAGYQQRHIQDAAYRVQRQVEAGERVVVGVNRFTDGETVRPPLQRIDPALEREQVERIRQLRRDPRRGRLRGGAGPPGSGRARHRQRHAGHHRGGRRARHARRDQRSAAGRLGRAPRGRHGLRARRLRPASRPAEGVARSRQSTTDISKSSRGIGRQGPISLAHARRDMVEVAGRTFSRVHHVAVVVRDIEAALAFYRDTLGLTVELVLPIESDRVVIAFLAVGETKIELVQPTDDTTGVARFLASKGEGFHHVCVETPDVDATLADLAVDGVERHRPRGAPRSEGPVAFLHPRSCHGVLVELIEAPGGPAWARLGYDTEAPLALTCRRWRGQSGRMPASMSSCGIWVGESATRMPAASSAAILASAVPAGAADDGARMAHAAPWRGRAAGDEGDHRRVRQVLAPSRPPPAPPRSPPISPMSTMPSVSGSSRKSARMSMKVLPRWGRRRCPRRSTGRCPHRSWPARPRRSACRSGSRGRRGLAGGSSPG